MVRAFAIINKFRQIAEEMNINYTFQHNCEYIAANGM